MTYPLTFPLCNITPSFTFPTPHSFSISHQLPCHLAHLLMSIIHIITPHSQPHKILSTIPTTLHINPHYLITRALETLTMTMKVNHGKGDLTRTMRLYGMICKSWTFLYQSLSSLLPHALLGLNIHYPLTQLSLSLSNIANYLHKQPMLLFIHYPLTWHALPAKLTFFYAHGHCLPLLTTNHRVSATP